MYTQGEIVLVPFPFTDQKGIPIKRPALVISGNKFNKTDDIILVQITKIEHTDGYSILIDRNDLTKPLNFVSEIRCHKILIAEQSLIIRSISKLNHKIVKKVIEKINDIFVT
jgi:mRNA interferase MazF